MIAIWFRISPLESPAFLSPKFSFNLKNLIIPLVLIFTAIFVTIKNYISSKTFSLKYMIIIVINIGSYLIGQYYLTLLPSR
jgi:hypothetical protein